MLVRSATIDDHKAILQVAKLHKCTRDFGSHMFSPPEAYEKGWIRVGVNDHGEIIGFTCRRDKVRSPRTVLYFVGVDPRFKGQGLGWKLIIDMMRHSRHRLLELNCRKDNPALQFYLKHGFAITGEALKGEGHSMERGFP